VALFGIAHFVVGPFWSRLFCENFMNIIFYAFFIFKFFNFFYFIKHFFPSFFFSKEVKDFLFIFTKISFHFTKKIQVKTHCYHFFYSVIPVTVRLIREF